ncbi:MAG TPA: glycosyltransferase [Gammaproteobacteria bacterium]|nr:glycosyltransferase [Gammaproteobacteria bacterium]
MKILKVIHGYPPLYNAGSEVYSQMLCHGLSKNHEVHVFTREENPFVKDFSLRETFDVLMPNIKIHIVNIPLEKYRYQYRHAEIDKIFADLLLKIKPNIVHIGHLNHLSTSMVWEAEKQKIPLIYTLHDYWLMCPRGQFIQRNPPQNDELWALCESQENRKCAVNCYSGYFSGAEGEINTDLKYWTDWVDRRMTHIRDILKNISCFIAPSKYLYQRYVQEFGLPMEKVLYLDYGFDLKRLQNRKRLLGEPFTFGYIGTHIPAKGIQHLISAFGLLKGRCQLRIWGRPRSQNTEALRSLVASLPVEIQNAVYWLSEYRNEHIITDVFNLTDCIVVPSIWVENSPLVIHEALQAEVAVITANVGGMAEYIQHEKNGLLFEHRNVNSLAMQMQRLVNNPDEARRLGTIGYLQSDDANIPNLDAHVDAIEDIYRKFA